ncbi:reverse transcriptase [Devosia elaeis]|uniref:Reverse transcriptase n=1 Tax=Devosia elaeis TaxID=1770058 RepID=A0A178HP73_9HYPH|nr:reverse transcriptase [Devosia elaeis]OAM73878.1 reverse transcriptase [Devosia elaeis]
MPAWAPLVRTYPHFDPLLTGEKAASIALDPQAVAAHTFYPFIKYDERWTLFAEAGEPGRPKERPIRYAARLDACIFSYYRHMLSEPYERRLEAEGLTETVLAYRRVRASTGKGGKSNIDFAKEAFQYAQALGDCCAISLDISSFFESLDHQRLKSLWASLLGLERLPPDHFAVYKAMTRYAYVEKLEAYERLGFYGKKVGPGGRSVMGFLVDPRAIPVQLCKGEQFRTRIAGGDGSGSIIKLNRTPHGVPQGAPLSDLLANLYLLDFDMQMKALAESVGGRYLRYSDDILFVAPVTAEHATRLEAEARGAISRFGDALVIKEKKSFIHEFAADGMGQIVATIKPEGSNKGLEYLGFRYDGRNAYIRDKTLSALHRKIVASCRAVSIHLERRYRSKSPQEIIALYNFEALYQRFGAVDAFKDKQTEYRNWTFWTYAKKAIRTFGPLGAPMTHQVSRLRRQIRKRLASEVARACARR